MDEEQRQILTRLNDLLKIVNKNPLYAQEIEKEAKNHKLVKEKS
jgi:hypothetical protein